MPGMPGADTSLRSSGYSTLSAPSLSPSSLLLQRTSSTLKRRYDVENARQQERSEEIVDAWRRDVGIDSTKRIYACTAGSFRCQCDDVGAEASIERMATRDSEMLKSMSSDPVSHISIPDCLADAYLTRVLTAVPRARVVYLHIADDSVCAETDCERTHALRFELRSVSEAFPPTPRNAHQLQ